MASVEQNEAALSRMGLGLGYDSAVVAIGKHGPGYMRKHKGKGVRKPGGGMKNYLEPVFAGVKSWFLLERQHGRFVDKTDLFLEANSSY